MFSHRQLVIRSVRWLKNRHRCGVAITEGWRYAGERPDAIGWKLAVGKAQSILVECKASRGDFLADRKKQFRKRPELGMGNWRYYVVNEGVATAVDLPEGWGLAVVKKKQIRIVKTAVYFNSAYINDVERDLLYMVLRNKMLRGGH